MRHHEKIIDSDDRCPKCGFDVYTRYASLNKKRCQRCYHEWDWQLKDGQKPLIQHQR
jgi:hypothetical protein